jgi:hypothetical protein
MKNSCIFLFLIILTGCSKHDVVRTINSEFQPYIQRFILEAKARNIVIDDSNLIAQFTDQITIDGNNFCGQSLKGTIPHIKIIQSDACWNRKSDMNKEILVFHELGHALLNRGHENGTLPDGANKSIMHEAYLDYLYTKYQPDEVRKYYLDELFAPQATSPPTWASAKGHQVDILFDTVSTNSKWSFSIPFSSTDLQHKGTVNSTHYLSPSHSLSIESPAPTGVNQYSCWIKEIALTQIEPGSDLTLTVRIWLDKVTSGCSIVLRGDSGTDVALLATSQGHYEIKGDDPAFRDYSISTYQFPDKLDKLYIILILYGESTGTVYFDDIQLTKRY